ncbi:hypothetical protein Brsp07_04533 [Brucella sp. NBRC 14130]|uniref:hypothetical protein n=1 Tax=Brucella sp. NBRC 14130 TaxID=3075483 RepID=UPI0030AA25A5
MKLTHYALGVMILLVAVATGYFTLKAPQETRGQIAIAPEHPGAPPPPPPR